MTAPARELLSELRRLGVRVEPRGDRLHIDAPKGTLTPALTDRLRQGKPALLQLLSSEPGLTDAERDRIHRAGLTEEQVPPLVTQARTELASLGAELVAIEPAEPVDWAERARALVEALPDADQRTAACDHFEERAAILEYEHHHGRQEAERLAFAETCKLLSNR